LKGHSAGVKSVAFTPDGLRLTTGSDDKTVKLWDAHTGTPRVDLIRHTLGVMGIAFHPNRDASTVLTASADGTAKAWNVRTGEMLATYGRAKSVGMTGLALSPDGALFATSNADNTATIWDTPSGLPLRRLTGHSGRVTCIAFSADASLLATAGSDKTAKIWDVATGTLRHDLREIGSVRQGVAFSPNPLSPRLATAGVDKILRIWDALTGRLIAQFRLPSYPTSNPFTSITFSPDGSRILTGLYDGVAIVWDARAGTVLLQLHGHTSVVTCASFSPDGRRIVTGSDDKSVRIWDARTGTPLLELPRHTDSVTSVTFSPDGSRLATSCYGDVATVWGAGPGAEDNELQYRLLHTRPNPYRHFDAFVAAKERNDRFAASFHLDRWLSIQPYRASLYEYRNDAVGDPRLAARASFHHAEFAKTQYDRDVVNALAVAGDGLARRLVAQELLRTGKVRLGIPLLYECMLMRPAGSPPVEELLLAAAYYALNQRVEAARLLRVATDWIDRPRRPQRVANMVTHALTPWTAIGHAFAPVQDPRYNPIDWESWYECEIFRQNIEAMLQR
jgi:WD40 repeat protein